MMLRICSVLLLMTALLPVADAAETFQLDYSHSVIRFSVPFATLTEVEGRFTDFSGTVLYDDQDLSRSMVALTIKPEGINTANEARDKHLKSADFFDVEKFPVILFQSTSISKQPSGYLATGKLTMHGVTKEISFPFEATRIIDTWENTRIGIRANLKLSRNDFAIGNAQEGWWNKIANAQQSLVSDEVQIDVKLQGVIWNIKRIITTGEDSMSSVLFKTIMESGIEEALKQFERMKAENVKEERFNEDEFGALGRKLATENKDADAIRIFQLGLQTHPRSTYLHNKLGDAYEKTGRKLEAADLYNKALAIDPYDTNAVVMLRKVTTEQ